MLAGSVWSPRAPGAPSFFFFFFFAASGSATEPAARWASADGCAAAGGTGGGRGFIRRKSQPVSKAERRGEACGEHRALELTCQVFRSSILRIEWSASLVQYQLCPAACRQHVLPQVRFIDPAPDSQRRLGGLGIASEA